MYALTSYAAYLIISIGLTIWVARTLSKNGFVFLTECFGHDQMLAASTNHLLVGAPPESAVAAIQFLSGKIGIVVVALGLMHFFNMNAIAKFGRKVGQWFREEQWASKAGPSEA